jgi:hypothetical protein
MTRIIDIVPGRDAGHVAGPFPSDFPIADGDYVGYFCNAYGEELVFVQRKGEATATLLHSDCDWQPIMIDGPPGRGGPQLPTGSGGSYQLLTVGKGDQAVILNEAEASWLTACWQATHERS